MSVSIRGDLDVAKAMEDTAIDIGLLQNQKYFQGTNQEWQNKCYVTMVQ